MEEGSGFECENEGKKGFEVNANKCVFVHDLFIDFFFSYSLFSVTEIDSADLKRISTCNSFICFWRIADNPKSGNLLHANNVCLSNRRIFIVASISSAFETEKYDLFLRFAIEMKRKRSRNECSAWRRIDDLSDWKKIKVKICCSLNK